ncbi:hypothetical protein BDK51DRAFT_28804 [Blyttiomyces helicus]|uniref:Uncharacterized protein n=1 Tax=Blyttiomyces helicus TaxID=388810 RepID=A0A4P9WMH7_9FUNG|nr:hypothetical protein BDK51DRAFT_28804 [Blyttiomyces helicus]|eukprot:RKO94281.1 hypothetical protein BDK51DRAFT_28804 [Blyttiomyces helicus]
MKDTLFRQTKPNPPASPHHTPRPLVSQQLLPVDSFPSCRPAPAPGERSEAVPISEAVPLGGARPAQLIHGVGSESLIQGSWQMSAGCKGEKESSATCMSISADIGREEISIGRKPPRDEVDKLAGEGGGLSCRHSCTLPEGRDFGTNMKVPWEELLWIGGVLVDLGFVARMVLWTWVLKWEGGLSIKRDPDSNQTCLGGCRLVAGFP